MKLAAQISGGMDSALAAWYVKNLTEHELVGGICFITQKVSSRETRLARDIAGFLGIKEFHCQTLSQLEYKWTAEVYVPYRNLLFDVKTAMLAHKTGCRGIVTGVNGDIYEDYDFPDSTRESKEAVERALAASSDKEMNVFSPLLEIQRAWMLAVIYDSEIEAFNKIISETSSCWGVHSYKRMQRNEWGRGCGECESCVHRKREINALLELV